VQEEEDCKHFGTSLGKRQNFELRWCQSRYAGPRSRL
jgi:hypothetical protein